jgi:hypothetical protein
LAPLQQKLRRVKRDDAWVQLERLPGGGHQIEYPLGELRGSTTPVNRSGRRCLGRVLGLVVVSVPKPSPFGVPIPAHHKMLWLFWPPHLPGHKMSGNYIRVIPPLSTIPQNRY